MSAPAVVERATRRYGSLTAVDDVSLAIGAGERVALLGHNGAGKTTLMKLLLGLTRPTDGAVRVLGEDPTRRGAVKTRRDIGFLPENLALYDGMTGPSLLEFYARLKGVSAREGRRALDRVGLAEAGRKRIGTYSKGMRQRLGLAQALLGRPRLLLLDEPTSGLDPASRSDFYESVRGMADNGAAVLLSSHALTELEAQQFARIAIMKQGRLMACEPLDSLRAAAPLPSRLRLAVAPGAAAAVAERFDAGVVARVEDRTVELSCPPGETMALVRHIAGLGGAVRDMEIRPPTLDALYAFYREDESSS